MDGHYVVWPKGVTRLAAQNVNNVGIELVSGVMLTVLRDGLSIWKICCCASDRQ